MAMLYMALKIVEILEDARFTVYEDKREMIVTSVSTSSSNSQTQSHKGNLRSNKVGISPRLHLTHRGNHIRQTTKVELS